MKYEVFPNRLIAFFCADHMVVKGALEEPKPLRFVAIDFMAPNGTDVAIGSCGHFSAGVVGGDEPFPYGRDVQDFATSFVLGSSGEGKVASLLREVG